MFLKPFVNPKVLILQFDGLSAIRGNLCHFYFDSNLVGLQDLQVRRS